METRIRILDNGTKVVLEDGDMLSDGSRIHVVIFHNKMDPQNNYYDVDEYLGDYGYDLTGRYLYDYLNSFRHLPEDEDELSVKFTELWYEVINGDFVEMKRQETSYSDGYIKQKLNSASFPTICVGEEKQRYEDEEEVIVLPPPWAQ